MTRKSLTEDDQIVKQYQSPIDKTDLIVIILYIIYKVVNLKINIVYNNKDKENHILKRLAKTFTTKGFTLSEYPSLDYDINYLFPYLLVDKHRNWILKNKTKTTIVSYFTHYDINDKEKVRIWNFAKDHSHVLITSSKIYYDLLKPYGIVHLVTPPLGI